MRDSSDDDDESHENSSQPDPDEKVNPQIIQDVTFMALNSNNELLHVAKA